MSDNIRKEDDLAEQPEFSVERAMPNPVASPPLPSEVLAEGSESRFIAEALTAVESDTPAPPGREKVSQSYWSLVWWKFKKNKLAILGAVLIITFYLVCVFFAEFFAPYTKERESEILEARPTWFHFIDEGGSFHLRP